MEKKPEVPINLAGMKLKGSCSECGGGHLIKCERVDNDLDKYDCKCNHAILEIHIAPSSEAQHLMLFTKGFLK